MSGTTTTPEAYLISAGRLEELSALAADWLLTTPPGEFRHVGYLVYGVEPLTFNLGDRPYFHQTTGLGFDLVPDHYAEDDRGEIPPRIGFTRPEKITSVRRELAAALDRHAGQTLALCLTGRESVTTTGFVEWMAGRTDVVARLEEQSRASFAGRPA